MNYLVQGRRLKSRVFAKLCFLILIVIPILFFCIIQGRGQPLYFVPAAPVGPHYGLSHIAYEYKIYTTNTNANWRFIWDDETTSDWLQPSTNQTFISATHIWEQPGEYEVRVQFKNQYLSEGIYSESLIVTIYDSFSNNPPEKPLLYSKLPYGSVFVQNTFSATTTDSDDDRVQFRFKWDSNELSNWTKPVPSNATVTETYKWSKPGTYAVSCQAKDQHQYLSDWSDPVYISIFHDQDYDTLSDPFEQTLGSDKTNPDDVTVITIHSHSYYIVTTKNEHLLFNASNQSSIPLTQTVEGYFKIDLNQDNIVDFYYVPSDSQVVSSSKLSPKSQIPTLVFNGILFLTLIVLLVTVFFILMKLNVIYIYKEEVIIEES